MPSLPSKKSLYFFKYSTWQKNLLPLGLTVIILMMVITSSFELLQREKNSEFVLNTVENQNTNSELLKIMSQTILQRTIVLIQILQTDDPFKNDELSLILHKMAAEYVQARNTLEKQDLDEHLRTLLKKIKPLNSINGPVQYEIYDLVREEEVEKAKQLFVDTALPNQRIIFEIIQKMEDYQILSSQKDLNLLKRENYNTHLTLKIFEFFSVLASILLALYIIRRQSKSDYNLAYLASTDELTELPNRASFVSKTNDIINSSPDSHFAIVFFDIDYFKSINDNYGHEIGDKILQDYTAKVKANIGKGDFLARLGGDEFVLILQSIRAPKRVKEFVDKLSKTLDTTFIINKAEIFSTTSLGVCMYPTDGNDTKSLLRHADVAMYSAKKSGRNSYEFFSKENNKKLRKEHEITHALHSIMNSDNANDELRLVYQPLININDGSFTECEALLRWTNSKGKNISTEHFIELAEKTNLIEKINLYVIREACKQQYKWQRNRNKNVRININLSGNKAIFDQLLINFSLNLHKFKLSPSLFGLELTERTLFEISEEAIIELDKLRQLGVKISLDDFGTGYSSLSYLKKLPITTLKIDKAFISGIPNDKDDFILVKTIIKMAQSLNLEVVAEGVETIEQLKFLKAHACDIAQGYYFHRPLESKQISKLQLIA